MSVLIGSKELQECFIGSTPVKEIYVGSTLVWPTYPINDPQPYFAKIWVPDTSMEHWISSTGRYQGFNDWSYSFRNTQGSMEARYNQLIIVDGPWFRENCSYSANLGYYVNLTGDIGISSTLSSVAYQQQELLSPYSFVKDMPAMSDSAAWKTWSEAKCNINYIENYVSLDEAYSYGASSSTVTLSTKLYNTQQPVYVWYLRPVTYSNRYQCGPATNCKITGLTLATDKWWDQEYNPEPTLPDYIPYSTLFLPSRNNSTNPVYWGWSPAAGAMTKVVSGGYDQNAAMIVIPNEVFHYTDEEVIFRRNQEVSTSASYYTGPIIASCLTNAASLNSDLIKEFLNYNEVLSWAISEGLTYDDVFSMVKADPQAMQVLPSGGDYLIPLSAINKGETPLNYYSVYVIVHAQTMQADYWSGGCETSPGLTPYSEFSLGQTTIVPAYWDPNFAGLNTLFQG